MDGSLRPVRDGAEAIVSALLSATKKTEGKGNRSNNRMRIILDHLRLGLNVPSICEIGDVKHQSSVTWASATDLGVVMALPPCRGIRSML